MSKFATGKNSLAISDRSGQAFPYSEMVKEWTGALVHISEFEPKHPQIRRRQAVSDAIALQNARPQRFQQPRTVAENDNTLANSGGASVGVANLSLPGDFAFSTQDFQVTTNGITTTIHSMVPEDGSAQNRKRELISTLGNVGVSIT
jgi:hypothetical protein|tara:strand:+ start:1893 stop:2333 length:441 start_codon:yes stop_codon:yes gene_type:complete